MANIEEKKLNSFRNRDNTFIKNKVLDSKRRVEIEIGDEKEPTRFLPQFKTKHWDNECNFSIRLVDDDYDNGIIQITDNKKISWSRNGRTVRMYEKETGDEDGGFEFELEIESNPSDNIIRYSIRSKGFVFWYQPPMKGREEHVEGSYAVYHESKRNNNSKGKHYRTGKAFHIYRPWAEDANGNRVWCDINIDEENEELTITVPQDFIDTAIYPILIDPTIGYTSLGATGTLPTYANASGDSSTMRGQVYTLSADSTLDSIHVAMYRITGSDPQSVDCFASLHREDSAGADSHDLVVGIENSGQSLTSKPIFITFTGSGELLTADDYIISGLADGEDTDGIIRGRFDSGVSLREYFETSSGAGGYATRKAEDPWTETDSSTTNNISLYVTYTEITSSTFKPRVIFF